MEQVKLRAEQRTDFGTRPARRMRRTGKIPAVLYGRGLDPMTLSVDRRDLYGALHTEAGANALIDLAVDGAKKSFLTVAREVQRDPVRGEIVHLDFISISLDEAIHAEVQVEYLGTPAGVEEGGVVETIRTVVNIMALPMEIPASIPIDISAMVVNDTMKVADLPAVEGVEYLDDPEASLVTVIVPRIVEVEEPEEEELVEGEEEGEEGEEGDVEAGGEAGEGADGAGDEEASD
jgi:large subunit ribosomal protein L25